MSPVNHAEGVHEIIDWVAPLIDHTSADRTQKNTDLADECLERMRLQEFTDTMIREVAMHIDDYSAVVATRIRTQCPSIFASGEDVAMMRRVPHPASDTEV